MWINLKKDNIVLKIWKWYEDILKISIKINILILY